MLLRDLHISLRSTSSIATWLREMCSLIRALLLSWVILVSLDSSTSQRFETNEVCLILLECSINFACAQYYTQNTRHGSLALPLRSVLSNCMQYYTDLDIYLSWLTRWMAPESFFDGTWDLASDVWMFGVMLWGKIMAIFEPSVARRL